MIELEYQLKFTTPAFLGNAEQNGQWRTPPIKALLRQWWRVAYAAEHGFAMRVDDMRHEEGLLFGHAWLEDDTFPRDGKAVTTAARKSAVRIRLSSWAAGKLANWNGLDTTKVTHPEVKSPVGSQLYLGYGPLKFANSTAMKGNAAIQSGEHATLSLAVPNEHAAHIEHALTLMNHYGTLGGRSRNGWGSFVLTPQGNTPALGGDIPLRSWKEALALDWPHAIGTDGEGCPLIWQTTPHDTWEALMKTLAIVKIGLRTQFVFPNVAPPHPHALPRHWLSYPITKHTTRAFDRNARLPNTLRFKVRPAPGNPKQVVGVIVHVPCLPPHDFNPQQNVILPMWQSVHTLLDELAKPANTRGYASVTDAARRIALKPQLDIVTLKRIPE